MTWKHISMNQGFKKNKNKIVDYLLCYLIYASSRSPLKTHKTVCTHRERDTHIPGI